MQAECWARLGKLGFRRQKVLQVKSADAASEGANLSDAAIKARQASSGSYIEAEKCVSLGSNPNPHPTPIS